MPRIIFLLLWGAGLGSLWAQPAPLTLQDCLEAALAQSHELRQARLETQVAQLEQQMVKRRYLPELSASYEYRYNAIIPTSLVPVGQFNPIASDELRALQFGTTWQQNASISLYQPLFDPAIKGQRLSREIETRLREIGEGQTEAQLRYQVIQTFLGWWQAQLQAEAAALDSLRTWRSRQLIAAQVADGRSLPLELNQASINHNQAVGRWAEAMTAQLREQVVMAYLMQVPVAQLMATKLQAEALGSLPSSFDPEGNQLPASLEAQQLAWEGALIEQQMAAKRREFLPSLGVQGLLGANQFTNDFNPVQSNSWFGNSFLGLSLNVPLLTRTGRQEQGQQLALRRQVNLLEQEQLAHNTQQRLEILDQEQQQLQRRLALAQENATLYRRNVELLQFRLEAGQADAMRLNQAEIAFQQANAELSLLQQRLWQLTLEEYRARGQVEAFPWR